MDPLLIESLLKLVEPFTVPPGTRTDVQISQMQSSLTGFKFFKNLESVDFFKGISQYLTLEVFEPFEKIANFGEVLDRCFFVVYGSLSMLTPELNSPMSISQKEVKETLTKQTTFLRKNTIVLGNSKDLVNRIKSMIARSPVRRGSVKIDTEFIRKLSKISDFKTGKQINPNDSFGEFCLNERKPCNSYIESRTLTVCAVLTREDYQKALQAEEDRQNSEKADFLHEIPIFYQVSKNSLLKLASFFTVHKYSKGQIVYREDMPADMIYFIKSGDFQVSKCQDSITKKIIEIPKGFLSSQKSLLKVDNARDVKLSHEIQVAIRGKYEVLGYDEYFYSQVLRCHSCKCISAVGVLFAIKTSDFKSRVVDPDALRYLQTRIDCNLEREKFLEGAGKFMSSMSKLESKTILPQLNSLTRGDEYLKNLISSMHEKKIEKKGMSQVPSSPWNYPSVDYSFLQKPRKAFDKFKGRSLSPKSSDMQVQVVKVKERIKRVPPPNFMIGMRDLQRAYDQDLRIEQTPVRSRNLSSIY